MVDVLDHLITLAPENSYPYYLKAYYYMRINDHKHSIEVIQTGNQKKIFDNYQRPLTDLFLKTSLFLNYPLFSAYHYSLSRSPSSMIYMRLTKFHLNQKNIPETTLQGLKQMAEKLSTRSNTFLFKIVLYNIQKKIFAAMKQGKKWQRLSLH